MITKLEYTADYPKMCEDLQSVLQIILWPQASANGSPVANQIGLTHRKTAQDKWLDAAGSLIDRSTGAILARESDFSEINDQLPEYTKLILLKLTKDENFILGRVRYMRLNPKTGLSIHADQEERYHYVLRTTPYALFGEYTGEPELPAKCYHIPADGHFYHVNTRLPHFVYNGGSEPRIHLVICKA